MSGTHHPAGGKRRRGSKDGVSMSIGKTVHAAGPAPETVLPQERTSGAIDWTAERRKTQAFLADLEVSAQAATRREAREGVRFGTL